jgi:hypothetical protein
MQDAFSERQMHLCKAPLSSQGFVGRSVIDLADVVGNASVKATLVPAGAVAPMLSLASNANQCSFAQVSRDAVRGGPFIALTADLPQSSIYVSFCTKTMHRNKSRGQLQIPSTPLISNS